MNSALHSQKSMFTRSMEGLRCRKSPFRIFRYGSYYVALLLSTQLRKWYIHLQFHYCHSPVCQLRFFIEIYNFTDFIKNFYYYPNGENTHFTDFSPCLAPKSKHNDIISTIYLEVIFIENAYNVIWLNFKKKRISQKYV